MNDFYKLRDSLQAFDPAMIERILFFDEHDTWKFVLDNLDRLKSLEHHRLGFLYGLPHGFAHFEKCFHRDWDEDWELILQALINEFAFVGQSVRLDFIARSAYLVHPSSTKVKTSKDLVPGWSRYSEANQICDLFDVLDADQVNLIAEGLKNNRDQISPDEYLDYLKVEIIENACRANPKLRAAYIYDTR